PPPSLHALSLHDALPILPSLFNLAAGLFNRRTRTLSNLHALQRNGLVDFTGRDDLYLFGLLTDDIRRLQRQDVDHVSVHLSQFIDRKSTRLNSSHVKISY